jgi:hypothetical protein
MRKITEDGAAPGVVGLTDDEIIEIVDALNEYEGDNIWEDIIYHLPIDDAAIRVADPTYMSDTIILRDGTRIIWFEGEGVWREADEA